MLKFVDTKLALSASHFAYASIPLFPCIYHKHKIPLFSNVRQLCGWMLLCNKASQKTLVCRAEFSKRPFWMKITPISDRMNSINTKGSSSLPYDGQEWPTWSYMSSWYFKVALQQQCIQYAVIVLLIEINIRQPSMWMKVALLKDNSYVQRAANASLFYLDWGNTFHLYHGQLLRVSPCRTTLSLWLWTLFRFLSLEYSFSTALSRSKIFFRD